jgi:hypothetical protein
MQPANSNITINTQSNVDYSLSVDEETFLHKTYPSIYISNQIVTSYLPTNSSVR